MLLLDFNGEDVCLSGELVFKGLPCGVSFLLELGCLLCRLSSDSSIPLFSGLLDLKGLNLLSGGVKLDLVGR